MSLITGTNKRLIQAALVFFSLHLIARHVFSPLGALFGHIGFFVVSLWVSWQIPKLLANKATVKPTKKAVLITGCDTGFGKELAKTLDRLGFHVFAGCINDDSCGAIDLRTRCSDRLTVIKLNVTQDKDVDVAVDLVKSKLRGNKLWAVVNNAGVASYTGTQWGKDTDGVYKLLLEVNTLGSVRVTRAFLPLMRANKGARVVFMGSMADRFVFPGLTPYAMSKYSVRAFADGLRREISAIGVNVCVVEPTMYLTPMTATETNLNNLRTHWTDTPENLRNSWGDEEYHGLRNKVEAMLGTRRKEAVEVVDALVQSVTQKEPQYFYRVYGIKEVLSFFFMELMPEEIQDYFLDGNTFNTFLKLINNRK